jgi:rhodanese-related sulfurtransferase
MKLNFVAGFLAGALVLVPAVLSSRPLPKASQQAASSAKSSQSGAASAKDPLPFPNVPRITAEEVSRLMKEKGNIVLVDTDDSVTYEAEHIKGAINIGFNPTGDVRDADQTLGVLPGDKLIVFYCNCPHEEDSAPMVLEMWQLGYDHDKVKALQGGITRWEQLGYPLAGSEVNKNTSKGQ